MQRFDVKSVLQKLSDLGVSPNKKLGQNFLINQTVCENIVKEGLKNNPEHIVEVGPGLGALTEFALLSGIPLTLIELDRGFVQYWNSREPESEKFRILHEDALQLDWASLNLPSQTLLLSNLPYQISSSIVIERSIYPLGVSRMILMFQKEVGARLLAKHKTKDYGLLTVIAQAFWNVSLLSEVGPKDFYPPPQVASRVLTFDWENNEIPKPEKFLSFVKVAFSQRRKFMVSNLSQSFDKALLLQKFQAQGLSDKARAEDLSVQQFIELFKSLV